MCSSLPSSLPADHLAPSHLTLYHTDLIAHNLQPTTSPAAERFQADEQELLEEPEVEGDDMVGCSCFCVWLWLLLVLPGAS